MLNSLATCSCVANVPVAFGRVKDLSAVGSATDTVVSKPSAVAPSNIRATPVSKETDPVKVGEARGAFKSRAVCVDVDTGLLASVVLSTEPKPTIDLVMPLTVPVNVGLAIVA